VSWIYKDTEFVKVFRKMVDWEWYTDTNTKAVFLHCLLKANWRAGSWHGYKYERGQFITSLPTLSKETGLSIQEVRTALAHLKSTGELTDKKYPKFRIITVNSYDDFQTVNRQINSQATAKQQAVNRQPTADRRIHRNHRNEENIEEVRPSAYNPFAGMRRAQDG
jgi:hypothetical protein